jgi:hypothetical protein
MRRRVLRQVDVIIRGIGKTAPAIPLIEQHHSVLITVEEPAKQRRDP